MGFFDGLKKFCSNVYNGAKEVASEIKEDAKRAARWTGEKIQKGAQWVADKLDSVLAKDDAPEWEGGSSSSGSSTSTTYNSEEEKAEKTRQAEDVADWQAKVQKKARKREKTIQNTYKKLYEETILQLEEIFDEELIDDIQSYIDEKSKSFKNQMRDEVNTKVSSSYSEWDDLMSDPDVDVAQIQKYCDEVYNTADDNLLDSFTQAVSDTNNHIKDIVNKYNNDRAKHLKSLKDSLIKLSSDEATKSAEIKSIYEKLAVIQFINNESDES